MAEWIPVSRELPEKSGDYLVYVAPECEEPYISIEEIDCEGALKEWNYYKPNEVVAWMPLPEPYDETKDHCSPKCTDYDYCEYCDFANVCENCKA